MNPQAAFVALLSWTVIVHGAGLPAQEKESPSPTVESRGTALQDADSNDSTVFLEGVVTGKKKYSLSILGPESEVSVSITPQTVIAARIVRPEFNLEKKEVAGIIPASAPDGRFKNNRTVTYSLPPKLYFRHQFESPEQLQQKLEGDIIQLEGMVLSKIPLPEIRKEDRTTELQGELQNSNQAGEWKTSIDGVEKRIRPVWTTLVIEGFNLLDITPLACDVFVNADQVDGELHAKRIEFCARVSLKEIFAEKKPKCLVIGDSVSFNYLPPLIKELETSVAIHHPNTNCLGSANVNKLHRWVGGLQGSDFVWDIIVFNFGHADCDLDQNAYQSNLRQCLDRLKRTGSKLVWLESTPIPYGFNDKSLAENDVIPEKKRFDFEYEETNPKSMKPGRMKLQNRWAREVLDDYPGVVTCQLWDVVKDDPSDRYHDWWFSKSANFKYPQAVPLAKAIAKVIRDQLKID